MKSFIDLFAGIGGMRIPFDELGCKCVFTSEIDKFAKKTYIANFGEQYIHGDIREVDINDIPKHDLLLAGFPCQPFSIAGRRGGFQDKKNGDLFFYIAHILSAHQPKAFLLENVKNLITHDRGRTFAYMREKMAAIGYHMLYEVIDAKDYLPQHRERVYIVGLRSDLYKNVNFQFPIAKNNIKQLTDIISSNVDDKYTLSDRLWNCLQRHANKHKKQGNGFGFGLVDLAKDIYARTLSARYYKDGSEILIKQEGKNPRRLTPRECANLMGFPSVFKIPVSDTQAYRQFGNAVAVPVIRDIALALEGCLA